MLIVFEGPDGSGKTTHSKHLAAHLGYDWACFPDRTTQIGKVIDRYLKGDWKAISRGIQGEPELNALIFQGLQLANRTEKLDRLRQSHARHLVLDRYWQSGYAYGKLDGLDPEYLMGIHSALPQASLNILLDLPVAICAERLKAAGKPLEHYERLDKLIKIQENYNELWNRMQRSHTLRDQWVTVNGMGTKEEVNERIVRAARDARR